jgi:hypothetical protein
MCARKPAHLHNNHMASILLTQLKRPLYYRHHYRYTADTHYTGRADSTYTTPYGVYTGCSEKRPLTPTTSLYESLSLTFATLT